MKIATCLTLCTILLGCASEPPPPADTTHVEEFSRLIAEGSDHEIGTAMTQFFVVDAPVSKHSAIIPLANQTLQRDCGPEYFFWFRGRDPKQEGDYWVQVAVDKETQTIKRVLINGYVK